MYKITSDRKAQSTLEACIIIVLVVVALIVMQGFITRAVQRNWRTNTDSFSDEQFDSIYSSEEMPVNENVPAAANLAPGTLIFKDPTIYADVGLDGAIDQTFRVGSGSGTIQVSGWGRYD